MSDSYRRAQEDAFRRDQERRQEQDLRDRRHAWDDQERRSRERAAEQGAKLQSSGSIAFEDSPDEGLLERPKTAPGTLRTNFGIALLVFGALGVVLNLVTTHSAPRRVDATADTTLLASGLLVAGAVLWMSGRSAARRHQN